MKAIGVIPARWQSSRFEGKVLAELQGKPIIQHVWERASECDQLEEVLVAVDEDKVLKAVEAFGAKAVMTRPEHQSGSDRIAEVIQDLDIDIVVNIQGDEPLIEQIVIDRLVEELKGSDVPVGTVIKSIDDEKEINDPNVVKVVIDQNHDALYFSRSVIPYHRDEDGGQVTYFKHLGLYAYRKDFLLEYSRWPKSSLEEVEKLEQLRILEAGHKIRTIETDFESVGIDTPEDLKRVAKMLK